MKILHPFRFLCGFGSHSIINDAYVVLSSDGGTKLGEYYNFYCKRCGKKFTGFEVYGSVLCEGMPEIPDGAQAIPVREYIEMYDPLNEKIREDYATF